MSEFEIFGTSKLFGSGTPISLIP